MRHGATGRRGRNRGGNGGGNGGGNRRGGNNRAQVFDSNGPEVRIRGTAYQIQEKYAALAKDAQASGDYVLAESYLQHAEHYQRIINSWDNVPQQRYEQPQHIVPPGSAQPEIDDLGLPGSIIGTPAKAESAFEDA